ncbi:ATP-binding protein [Labilibaculum euxinus]
MEHLKTLYAAPTKRIYQSIVVDYDLNLAICELIDNSLDSWFIRNKVTPLKVSIELDPEQQSILFIDNAGGVKLDDIVVLVSPGASKNNGDEETIGLFGVGSKRAIVALAEEAKCRSRYETEETVQVNINDEWINNDNWNIAAYKSDKIIPENSTEIELFKLRGININEEKIQYLENHLSATYARFIDNGNLNLVVNEKKINARFFNVWSYPPNMEPTNYNLNLTIEGKDIEINIIAGLTKSGEPSEDEYGFYFYCNDRLISRARKGFEFGYSKGKIGFPHPAISLVRVIVTLKGPSKYLPWNSSKSDINTKSKVFTCLQETLIEICKRYSRINRTTKNWPEQIFRYTAGNIVQSDAVIKNLRVKNLYLPPIPKSSNKKLIDTIKIRNRSIIDIKPWANGAMEAYIAINEIKKLALDQKNRLVLLILDSAMEIAFKDYLVNDSRETYSETRLTAIMKNRSEVHKEVKKNISFDTVDWPKIEYYYKLRCDLVHKRASADISDHDVQVYQTLYEKIMNQLFSLQLG